MTILKKKLFIEGSTYRNFLDDMDHLVFENARYISRKRRSILQYKCLLTPSNCNSRLSLMRYGNGRIGKFCLGIVKCQNI